MVLDLRAKLFRGAGLSAYPQPAKAVINRGVRLCKKANKREGDATL